MRRRARRTAIRSPRRRTVELSYRFGKSPQESPKPDEIIPMRIRRVAADAHGMERWSINGQIYSDRAEPQVLSRGRRYRLALNNGTPEAHPLHLHRNTFELVRIGAHRTAGLKKDVITLPPVPDSRGRLRPTGSRVGAIPLPSTNAYGDGFYQAPVPGDLVLRLVGRPESVCPEEYTEGEPLLLDVIRGCRRRQGWIAVSECCSTSCTSFPRSTSPHLLRTSLPGIALPSAVFCESRQAVRESKGAGRTETGEFRYWTICAGL